MIPCVVLCPLAYRVSLPLPVLALTPDQEAQMTWIILPPERLIFAVGPEDKVYVQLRYSPEQTGLAPDVELAIALTPAEARAFSDVLLRKASEAEAAARKRRGH